LHWDGEVVYQSHSQRQELYNNALQQLIDVDQVYTCTCTRKALIRTAERGEYGIIYPGTCGTAHHSFELSRAIRVRTNNKPVCFDDVYKGRQCQNLQEELGDFVIKRSDGHFAYQLAVVVDDEAQGITEVVRGEDLLNNTDNVGGMSGWNLLMNKINPIAEKIKRPNMIEILSRASMIGGLAQRKKMMDGIADLYLQPPVNEFSLMPYKDAEEIENLGYQYAKQELQLWLQNRTIG
jgi:hypothetical protein